MDGCLFSDVHFSWVESKQLHGSYDFSKVHAVAVKLLNVYGTATLVCLFGPSWLQTGMILVPAQRSQLFNTDKGSGVAIFILHLNQSVCDVRKYTITGNRDFRSVRK